MRLRKLLVLMAALLALAAPGWGLAQAEAVVAVQAPAQTPAAGATFTTPVTIGGGSDVLGFQVDVEFDPAALAVERVELGPFLASSGRSVLPLGPDLSAATAGKVTFGGYTLGQPEQAGAAGDGVLAVVTWRAVQAGQSRIRLTRPLLAGPQGVALPVRVDEPLTVEVGGAARLAWLWGGLLAALAALGILWLTIRLRRRRSV